MPIIHYDDRWNANEWFVIGFLVAGYALVTILPKRFSPKRSAVFILYGIFIGLFTDHSISVQPVDFYDVNDSSSYEVMDFLTYVMYGSCSYLYAYLLDRWKVKPAYMPLYVFIWSLLSIASERAADLAGVFHYKNGYSIGYSFPIYLLFNSAYLIFLLLVNGSHGRRGVESSSI